MAKLGAEGAGGRLKEKYEVHRNRS